MTKPARPKFASNENPSGQNGRLPYRSQGSLLSEGELRFYCSLQLAIEQKFLVCPKVRLADIISVPAKLWKAAEGRKISQRHVDWVLADPIDLSIKAVIELDDKTHLEASQKVKDAYLGDALRSAGIVLIRFPIYREYCPKRIGQLITDVLNRHCSSSSKARRRRSGISGGYGLRSGRPGARLGAGSTSRESV